MVPFIEEVSSEENKKVSLAWQILLALVLGILLGSYLHYHAESRDWLISNLLTPAGDIFIHLIKMIVVPIVISTLVVGIAGVGDAKQLGRIGAKTIIYFEVITTVAIVLGITLANVFQPGTGIDMSQLAAVDISKYQNTTAEVQPCAWPDGHHPVAGADQHRGVDGERRYAADYLLLGAVWLGLSSLPATHREPLVTVFRSISETMFKVTHMVMRYAPIGVFALISVTVATFGFASLWPLAKLVLLVYFAILFFALVVLGIVARLCGLSIWILIRILKDELILATPPPARRACCRALSRRWKPMARRRRSPALWCRPVTPLTSMVQRCIRASRRSLSPSCTVSTSLSGRRSPWC
jgi:proton glutamate symport protein